jgi:hypothetical protein
MPWTRLNASGKKGPPEAPVLAWPSRVPGVGSFERRTKRPGENPLARFFLNGQTIKMSAYEDHLKEGGYRRCGLTRWVRGLDDTEDFRGDR